jgi:bacillithiol synthase
MENSFKIPYHSTGNFSRIFLDYLDANEKLKPFYEHAPEVKSFEHIISNRKKISIDRANLVSVIQEQYQNIQSSTLTKQNIASLLAENTFTITTGHQLGLFTAELYFIYKIITCINLAKQVSIANPGSKIIPVFWMATEDHDFEEINHANIAGTTFEWKQQSGGAVGAIETNGIDKIINSLDHYFGSQPGKEKIIQLFKLAYSEKKSLADATRILVNELFKEDGLIIIDANHPKLKKEFSEIISRDVFEQNSFVKVSETNTLLEKQYPIQVNPREINFFYLSPQSRSRIIKTETGFETADQKCKFSAEELQAEINHHPENFSPNVLMRPLYQECILPNLAYVGGPGEIAYWMQLKSTFAHYNIPFPLIAWRNSFALIEKKQLKSMLTLLNQPEDIFKPLEAIVNEFVQNNSQNELSLATEQQSISLQLSAIHEKLAKIDTTLLATVSATDKKIAKLFTALEKKMLKAEKKKQQVGVNQIVKLKSSFFPNGILQERIENFSAWYLKNNTLLTIIKNNSEPLSKTFQVIAID